MGEPAKRKRIPKRANKRILTNQFGKSIGTIFAGQYAIGWLGGVSHRLVNTYLLLMATRIFVTGRISRNWRYQAGVIFSSAESRKREKPLRPCQARYAKRQKSVED